MRSEATNEDGTCSITAEKIVEKVLGTKSGYIKGSGFGPQPTTTRFSKSAIHEVYQKNQELEDTIQAQSQEIKALNERSAKFEEFMAKFKDQMADVQYILSQNLLFNKIVILDFIYLIYHFQTDRYRTYNIMFSHIYFYCIYIKIFILFLICMFQNICIDEDIFSP